MDSFIYPAKHQEHRLDSPSYGDTEPLNYETVPSLPVPLSVRGRVGLDGGLLSPTYAKLSVPDSRR